MRTIRITTDHDWITKVVDEATGEIIQGITAIDIHIDAGASYAILKIVNPTIEIVANDRSQPVREDDSERIRSGESASAKARRAAGDG